jgi:DNA polymerase-3 subunit delta'
LAACDVCPGCIQVEAGTHPDVFAVSQPEGSLTIPIEAMRELGRSLWLKPARGRGKVAIIDDADNLNDPITNNAAANCFLKTLEEPPPGSTIFMIGTSPHAQLPTVLSRCQVVRFAPLPTAVVADLLRSGGVEAVEAERLARLSGGSLGQAQALADPALWSFRRNLLDGLLKPEPDSVALARQWMQFVEEAGKEASLQRRRASLVLQLLVGFFNDALRQRIGGTPHLVEPEDRRRLQELSSRADPDKLLDILERCLEGDGHIDRRVQLALALEGLVDALGQKIG